MLIKVKDTKGKIIDINVKPTDTILNIKEAVREIEGYLLGRQILVSYRQILTDSSTVDDYLLTEGSVIHLVLRCGCVRCRSGYL